MEQAPQSTVFLYLHLCEVHEVCKRGRERGRRSEVKTLAVFLEAVRTRKEYLLSLQDAYIFCYGMYQKVD